MRMTISTHVERDFAIRRSELISSIDYEIFLNLPGGSEFYEGKTIIRLEFTSGSKALDLDFISHKIQSIKVNGSETIAFTHHKNRLSIPKDCFACIPEDGQHRIEICYQNRFDKNGMGLHRYMEPGKDQEFIFSDLEPAECQRVFPCFDQPDLKASFTVSLETPGSWTVASNGSLKKSLERGQRCLHSFHPSLKISTYLFCLIAGDYEVLEDLSSKIPLRLFYRPSMREFIPSEEIFSLTQKSLDHFESLLGIDYPFDKHDQAFVPEFSGGAMENAALVVFTEQYLPRHQLTTAEEFDFAGTIVHEMAHMWFGNLVTMKWWNDLWLNEAFATYFGYILLPEVSRFQDARLYFCQEVKSRALQQDQLSTSHPIISDCPDTVQAFANFDCITYEKGAAVVGQLLHLLGHEKFMQGVLQYLKDFAFDGSTWKDFLSSMQAQSALDLQSWADDWLQNAGINTVFVEPVTSNAELISLKITQLAPAEHPRLRTHKMRVALYQDQPEKPMVPYEVLDLTYQGATTEIQIPSPSRIPDFVLPNFDDHDYVKARFEPDSLNFASSRYTRFEDPLVRQLILNSLNSMVEDAVVNPLYCLKWIWNTLEKEPLENLAVSMLSSFYAYYSSFLSSDLEQILAPRIRERALESLGCKTLGYDLKDQWFYLLRRSILTLEDSKVLESAIEDQSLGGLKLDLEKQWSVVCLLAALKHPQAKRDARILMDRDSSDRGEKRFFEIAISLSKDKLSCFKELIHNKERSADSARSGMRAFFHRLQKKENLPVLEPYFDHLLQVQSERDMVFSKDYCSVLFPFCFLDQSLAHLDRFLKRDLPAALKRALMENRDQLKKRQRSLQRFKTHPDSKLLNLDHQAPLSDGLWQEFS